MRRILELRGLCYRFLFLVVLIPVSIPAEESPIDEADWLLIAEASDSYRLGAERLQQFKETTSHLPNQYELPGKAKGDSSIGLSTECTQLNRRCIAYLRDEPAAARRAVANNPAYWESYRGLLEVTPIARLVEEAKDLDARSDVFIATQQWVYWEILNKGTLDVGDVHFFVQAHRRLLAESNFLIDKMIYLASVSISFRAINVLMAQRSTQPFDAAEAELLEEMLRPLSKNERSLRRTLRGEYQYMLSSLDAYPDYPGFDAAALRDVREIYAYASERSERSWSDYWGEGLDVWADVPLYTSQDELGIQGWTDWVTNTHSLNVLPYLLRALRETYDGRASPGIPSQPPPARWAWQWRIEEDELCLSPGDIHPSLVLNESPVCLPYLND